MVDARAPAPAISAEIVGVVGNVADAWGQIQFDPQIYVPYAQDPSPSFGIVSRAATDPSALAPSERLAVWSVDQDQPLGEVKTMAQVVREAQRGNPMFETLLGIFAGLALLLASVGIYGVIAYTVAQRTREISIRVALGAGRKDIVLMVIRKGIVLAAFGLAIGLVLSLPLPRLFASAFEGFSVRALGVLIAVPSLVGLAAIFASYVPACHATKIDPIVAMRYE